MNAHKMIKSDIDLATQVVMAHLEDLSDAELLHRPAPGCNHINWQLGHMIAAEHSLIAKELPGAMPPLPAGFADKYSSETAKLDDAKAFCTKAELLKAHQEQRAALLAALDKTSETELDRPLEGWTPHVGGLFAGAASGHWLMHVGQWSVIRRQLGRPPLF